jgi:hypothetical protein
LVIDFLEIGSHELFAIDCLRIKILLISASWVARITGVSPSAQLCCLSSYKGNTWSLWKNQKILANQEQHFKATKSHTETMATVALLHMSVGFCLTWGGVLV